jgi:Domain of unknown function (DUF1877)
MSCRGLHIALNDEELLLLEANSPDEMADYIAEVLEETKIGTPDCCETDKSWAYIHSAFNGTDPDGPLEMRVEPKVGFFSRLLGKKLEGVGHEKYTIMGHDPLLVSDVYYIGIVDSDRVQSVADALSAIPTESLGEQVRKMHRKFDASGSEGDAAEYAMGWYPDLVEFYRQATKNNKHVIFTVDY